MLCTSCHHEIVPVVAIDIDGTLAQYHEHFGRFLAMYLNDNEVYDRAMSYDGNGEFRDALQMGSEAYREAKLAFRAGGHKRWMPPFQMVPMFRKRLAALGVEVWITTTRPWMRLDNVDPDTREWLLRNHIGYSGLLYGDDKYLDLIDRVGRERIVAVFEDEAENISRGLDLELPMLMHRTQFNSFWHGRFETFSIPEASTRIPELVMNWRSDHG